MAVRSKLGRVTRSLVGSSSEVHMLIIGRSGTDAQITPVEELGLEVRLV
jgi:hypothetical protein